MSEVSKVWFRYALLFFGILCISWSAIFVKLADVPSLSSAFYRMFIGAIGILPLWFFRRKSLKDKASIRTAIVCGLFFGFDIAFWNTSIMLTKATISTLLANLAPIWVGLGAIYLLKEKPEKLFWPGTIIALAGVIVFIGIENFTSTGLSLGNTLAVVSSIFYAFYLLTTKKGRTNMDTVSFTAISMISSSVLLFFICLIFQKPFTGFSLESWGSLAGLGLISQLGGWLAINYALGYIKPTVASVSLLSQSVFTAIISIPVLGEFLSWIELTGAGIVLLGVYLVNRKNHN